jgi:hypothetical protein
MSLHESVQISEGAAAPLLSAVAELMRRSAQLAPHDQGVFWREVVDFARYLVWKRTNVPRSDAAAGPEVLG